MNEVVYIIIASEQINGDILESWVHCVCRDSLTADDACAKMNAEDKHTQYHVEEHEVY